MPLNAVNTDSGSTLERAAAAALSDGEMGATTLIARICNMPGLPAAVADQMAIALLGESTDFVRNSEGRWALNLTGRYGSVPEVASHVALERLRYLIVDVETTGVAAFGGDRITEIAAYALEGGQILPVFESLVNPQRPIPSYITRLTGISNSMVRSAPLFREISAEIEAAMHGRVFVAHNAAFDWRFITSEISRVRGRAPLRPQVCTVKMARALLPELRRRNLDSVAYHLGIEITARHRAGGDAHATARVLQRLIRKANDSEMHTWGQLNELLRTTRSTRRRRRR